MNDSFSNTTMLFGDSGTFKTTNLGFAARYLYEKTGKPVRLVTAEQYRPIQAFIDIGIIHICHVGGGQNPLVDLRKLSYGFWPTVQPNRPGLIMSPLAPGPDLTQHKRLLNERYSGYFIDGVDTILEMFMEDMRSKGRKISEEMVGMFTEEDEKFGASPKSHYGFTQMEGLRLIKAFGSLPVSRIIFTSHEAKGEESDTRAAIRGPALVGHAATDKVGKQVGNCIHAEIFSEPNQRVNVATKKSENTLDTTVRYYFQNHPDQKFPGVVYKCKTRLPPERTPDLLKRWPAGYFEPTIEGGLDWLLKLEDELLASQTGDLARWKQDVDTARAKAAEIQKEIAAQKGGEQK